MSSHQLPHEIDSSDGTNGAKFAIQTKLGESPRLFTSPPSLETLKKLCSQSVSQNKYPLAAHISHNIPIYDFSSFTDFNLLSNAPVLSHLQDEWHHILISGPGVLVFKCMFADPKVITSANAAFDRIIRSKNEVSKVKGDHFGLKGSNTRIWNSLQKHCMTDPSSFIDYYSNPWLAAISEAWLGPAYTITAQVNIVHAGGKAQTSHRDYHFGFQTANYTSKFPRNIQIASQFLTLQGAVAHSDMPMPSGPTRFLPFSQMFEEGFLAYQLPEFQAWFEENWVALELELGDAVFFNPALFHAAGENTLNTFDRKANLLQISNAMGKTMESLSSTEMVNACWEDLNKKYKSEGWSRGVECVVQALAQGYPFPTNLDKRVPSSKGMAPLSEQDLLRSALEESWTKEKAMAALRELKLDSAA